MKVFLLVFLSFVSAKANASCDLFRPEVRSMVVAFLKTRTNVDLSKAFWLNSLKSNTYSVFTVQYGTRDRATGKQVINTHLVSVSCQPNGKPFVDSDLSSSVLAEYLRPLN